MKILITAFCFLFNQLGISQKDTSSVSETQRIFMPALQLGYVGHLSHQLSGGIMFQTSLEYRHKSNAIFRLNYDDFNANFNIEYPLNDQIRYTGSLSFFEISVGAGLRKQFAKHNAYGLIQGGLRGYGYPQFDINEDAVNFYFTKKNATILRYTLGYEYEFFPQIFLTFESFIGHPLSAKDFWQENIFSWGITTGVSMTLF